MEDTPAAYAHPEALVSTSWLAQHLNDPTLRIIESNEDILLYDTGHIPGAVHIDWRADLNDQLIRDYIDPEHFAALCAKHGITPETTVVFYGDKSNWWACYAFWVFQLFGHQNAKMLNGGRAKWIADGHPLTRDVPHPAPAAANRIRRGDGRDDITSDTLGIVQTLDGLSLLLQLISHGHIWHK